MSFSKFIIQTGLVASVFGFWGACVTGYAVYIQASQATVQKRLEVEQAARTEHLKLTYQARQAACAGALTYIGDEAPNPGLSPQLKSQSEQLVSKGLASCSVMLNSPSGEQKLLPAPREEKK